MQSILGQSLAAAAAGATQASDEQAVGHLVDAELIDSTASVARDQQLSTAESPVGAGLPALNQRPPEFGGRDGLEPTRYGDWEKNGRCIDF